MGMPVAAVFAREWIQAWNHRDVESLLSLYADDVEFRSRLVAKIVGDASGTISGKENLRQYFQKAFAAFSGELGLELTAVYQGVNSVVVLFQVHELKGAELMEFNASGAVCRAYAHGQAA